MIINARNLKQFSSWSDTIDPYIKLNYNSKD